MHTLKLVYFGFRKLAWCWLAAHLFALILMLVFPLFFTFLWVQWFIPLFFSFSFFFVFYFILTYPCVFFYFVYPCDYSYFLFFLFFYISLFSACFPLYWFPSVSFLILVIFLVSYPSVFVYRFSPVFHIFLLLMFCYVLLLLCYLWHSLILYLPLCFLLFVFSWDCNNSFFSPFFHSIFVWLLLLISVSLLLYISLFSFYSWGYKR